MAPYVLALGGRDDVQLVRVIEELRRRSVPVIFLDHQSPAPFALDVRPGRPLELTIAQRTLKAPTLMWSRIKILNILGHWSEELAPEYLRRAEWRALLQSIAFIFEHAALTKQADVAKADHKVFQLAVASRVGFEVPSSRI